MAADKHASITAPAHVHPGGDGHYDAELPLVRGGLTFHDVTELVSYHTEKKSPVGWLLAFALASFVLLIFLSCLSYLVWNGIGVWGTNIPVGWAWPIVDFVFWVGIGHAGTLISAILFLLRQRWRTSINRAAEAMTIFAVICALMFPLFHTGRPWFAIYWMPPIPNQMDMWPQFKSPLMWDVFAVSSYFTVSLIFWYVGLVPDLATLRDRAKTVLRQRVLGSLALGWTGANRHWRNYEKAYILLAGLATPLVLSVHSVVSFDFAVSLIPGWHTTIFPPYFVAGAIFSGFAMVVTLLVAARKVYGLENLITIEHLEKMNLVILLTGSLVAFSYIAEFFIAYYSGVEYESYYFFQVRVLGPYGWAWFLGMLTCNVLLPQLFWFKKMRRSIPVMFAISITTNIGMWFERFIITVVSLHRDYLPSSWGYFSPTWVDVLTLLGSFGLFFTLFLLFLRFAPMVAMSEVKAILPQADPHLYEGDGHTAHPATTERSVPYIQSEEESDDDSPRRHL
ncbi:MAG TPA: NrfD/PsrC family molybdoenzyme membrane anchor subunit [Rhodothermales bacterium]|nr:NrfD/PsrC family molybdoenzyme membrane anchor subunit [Rhodothermales bacterium]